MTTLRALITAAIVVATFSVAVAKLPAPPPMTDEQKAAAEEKKAKDAAAAETAKAQQGKAEDRGEEARGGEKEAKGARSAETGEGETGKGGGRGGGALLRRAKGRGKPRTPPACRAGRCRPRRCCTRCDTGACRGRWRRGTQ